MKAFAKLFALGALLTASAPLALASSFTIGSYGTANNPGSFINSALTYTGYSGGTGTPHADPSGTTYNVSDGGQWTPAVGSSSWVSFDPQAFPGGTYAPPDGNYTYTSTFSGMTASGFGTITVMADDTMSIFLNGTLIVPAAVPSPAPKCNFFTPNCTVPATYTLAGFTSGVNTLSFVVAQQYEFASGLDFSGQVSPTPEPNSLLLMGTGLVSAAGMLIRRRRIA